MSTRKSSYDKEFRDRILKELMESNRSTSEIAYKFGLDSALLRQWKYRYINLKKNSPENKISREDYEKIQKELDELKLEKNILLRTIDKLMQE